MLFRRFEPASRDYGLLLNAGTDIMGAGRGEEPTAQAVDIERIRKQIHYYFSDSNLPRDNFLRAKVEEHTEGYVKLNIISQFNRMKALGATVEHLVEAIKGSDLLELDETEKMVRRTTELPETPQWKTRAVRVKGWIPGRPPPSIESVEALFSPYGKVLSVTIRKYRDEDHRKQFKGSVFVEFENAEAAERAAAESITIQVEKEGRGKIDRELEILPIDAWIEIKKKEKKEKKEYLIKKYGKKIEKKPAKVSTGREKGKKTQAAKGEFTKGLILKFDGAGPKVSREDIREFLSGYGAIAWVDFDRGDAEGCVRFEAEGSAAKAVEDCKSGKLRFGGNALEAYVMQGEEEELYWKKLWEKQEGKRGVKRKYGGKDGQQRKGKRFRYSGRRHGERDGGDNDTKEDKETGEKANGAGSVQNQDADTQVVPGKELKNDAKMQDANRERTETSDVKHSIDLGTKEKEIRDNAEGGERMRTRDANAQDVTGNDNSKDVEMKESNPERKEALVAKIENVVQEKPPVPDAGAVQSGPASAMNV